MVAGITLPVGYGMATPARCALVISPQFVIDGTVTSNPVRPGHAPSGYAQGARGPAGPAELGSPVPRPPGMNTEFDFVLRGYDRNQVDARVAELVDQLNAARERAQAMEAQLAEERRRSEHLERQRQAAPAPRPAARPPAESDSTQGFGYRAERLLRMAEAEANEIRGSAIKEAAEIVERARAAAEMHRHEIEQNLIMRATTLDQQANELAVALREREQAAAAELASARTEAESLRAAARHEMEQARQNVEIVARDVRAQAERWAAEHRAAASGEVARLVELRDRMQNELGQLSANLLAAVKGEDEPPAVPTQRPAPAARAAHRAPDRAGPAARS
jgi:cell division septum initiation protein DivIVA